jgi:hypothetical protein
VAVVHELVSKRLFDDAVSKLGKPLLTLREWSINSADYPILDVTFGASGTSPFRLRLQCDDWDDQPPSIVFLTLEGEPRDSITQDPKGIFNASNHELTGRPFVCTPGSREYHTHSSHLTDDWSNYKNKSDFDLGGILTKLWRAWKMIPK